MDTAADFGTASASQIVRVAEVAVAPLVRSLEPAAPLPTAVVPLLSRPSAEGDGELGTGGGGGDDLNGVLAMGDAPAMSPHISSVLLVCRHPQRWCPTKSSRR
ncbi:Os07g0202400 [Oryza sativa Japonica Group]|uniref:Os07g0202400 protein n=2 Tax=Oryza sativa subsp. japonica TaxID=39947 RepID=Q6Z4K5_ORYSJ|nr:hypothetical protein OsJ_23478 [Oryza sativa Japonica Group]KAB8104685.1 hypothetical protein EE612_037725 [Oryza sativa]KAF2921845.1 hypothetical protein DAI22_07g065700 [Oryza sativa Japonica Group]BAC79772.1 unknown protein [Oryza sativa Japonica Group]BAC83835.1 unknown protein [Oryza sativa Japonica Group]|eukprot:NP_001059137.1 Os07g0202400 [Oryza sativa Japonica Group]